MTLVHLKLTQSTGNLQCEVRLLCCWLGLLGCLLSCPGSTERGYVSDEIGQTDRGALWGAAGSAVGLAMTGRVAP